MDQLNSQQKSTRLHILLFSHAKTTLPHEQLLVAIIHSIERGEYCRVQIQNWSTIHVHRAAGNDVVNMFVRTKSS